MLQEVGFENHSSPLNLMLCVTHMELFFNQTNKEIIVTQQSHLFV